MLKRWKSILLVLLAMPIMSNASLESTVEKMLASSQHFTMYNDNALGRTVIVIGLGMHRSENVSQEMARQDAMRSLTSFLKGEQISALDHVSQSWRGDQLLEEYYSTITTQLESSLNAAWVHRYGLTSKGAHYSVMVLSENGKEFAEALANQSSTVQARGVASLSNGVEAARSIALNNALRNAVEQYTGVQMASKTTVENAEDYTGRLSTVSSGHVSSYTVKEEFQRDGSYHIVIVAEVSEDAPEQSIDAITENMGRPSFYIKSDNDDIARLLRELLANNNLEVTSNPSSARYQMTTETSLYEYEGIAGMQAMQTTIRVRVRDSFNNSDLINISSDPNRSVEMSDSDVVRQRNSFNYAIEDLQPKLVGAIQQQFVHQFNNGTQVSVTLRNFDRLRDVEDLKNCIERLPLTRSVMLNPVQGREASYDVFYLGNPGALQLEIVKQAESCRLRGLRAQTTSSEGVVLTF